MKPSTRVVTTELDAAVQALDQQTARCVVALTDVGSRLLAAGQKAGADRIFRAAKKLNALPNDVRVDLTD